MGPTFFQSSKGNNIFNSNTISTLILAKSPRRDTTLKTISKCQISTRLIPLYTRSLVLCPQTRYPPPQCLQVKISLPRIQEVPPQLKYLQIWYPQLRCPFFLTKCLGASLVRFHQTKCLQPQDNQKVNGPSVPRT